ncbi:glycosyltransferase family 4 protein [Kineococcus sp. SYSU DK006]|uniref:glycosyltransferase family 4 protein n=1 Tax=Kineococcus sp. SYSU DK006 TaxID=3383127 RepID=UPI003D7D8832
MRIALVLTQDRAGPADLTVALALALNDLGVTVRVFGPRPVTSAGDVDHLLTEVEVGSKGDREGARALRAALDRFDPDLVHAQDRRSALAVTLLAGRPGTPVVATYHGLPDAATDAYARPGIGTLLRVPPREAAVLAADAAVARRCAVTVTPADAMRRFLRTRLGVPAARVRTILNGVPMHPVRTPPERPRVLVTTGSFSPRKAAGALVEAFTRLARDHEDLSLLLVGGSEGDQRPQLRERVERAGLSGRVTFTGYRTDVPAFLARADVFALPSLSETLPLALLEAMGAGLACVASDAGSTAEAMPPGTGLLVRPGDVDGLTDALRRLVEVPGLARALGASAAARAREAFSIERCAREHADLYAQVLSTTRRSTPRTGAAAAR